MRGYAEKDLTCTASGFALLAFGDLALGDKIV